MGRRVAGSFPFQQRLPALCCAPVEDRITYGGWQSEGCLLPSSHRSCAGKSARHCIAEMVAALILWGC